MSAAAGTTSTAEAVRGMTRKDVTCDYCNKLTSECMCCTAPTHSRYCDDCGRARQFCLCAEGVCSGCRAKSYECVCDKCSTCTKRVDECVCLCKDCKYPGSACRCYEEYEPHPDALCCPHCYSDPCECDKIAKQRDLNASKDYDCPRCGDSIKYCRCKSADGSHYDSDDD